MVLLVSPEQLQAHLREMAFVPAVRKFYTSAIVSLPPRRHVEKIQKIRLPHDKSAPRWMPHIPVYAPALAQRLYSLH